MRSYYFSFVRDRKAPPTQSEHLLFIPGMRMDQMNRYGYLSLVSIATTTPVVISSENAPPHIRRFSLTRPIYRLNIAGCWRGDYGYGSEGQNDLRNQLGERREPNTNSMSIHILELHVSR
jgi:hypothetical protein